MKDSVPFDGTLQMPAREFLRAVVDASREAHARAVADNAVEMSLTLTLDAYAKLFTDIESLLEPLS